MQRGTGSGICRIWLRCGASLSIGQTCSRSCGAGGRGLRRAGSVPSNYDGMECTAKYHVGNGVTEPVGVISMISEQGGGRRDRGQ